MATQQKNPSFKVKVLLSHALINSETALYDFFVLAASYLTLHVHIFSQLDGKYPYWKYPILYSFTVNK